MESSLYLGQSGCELTIHKELVKLMLRRPTQQSYVLAQFAIHGLRIHHLGSRANDWQNPLTNLSRMWMATSLMPTAMLNTYAMCRWLEEIEMEIQAEQLPTEVPIELQDVMNELHSKLEIAGEGQDLFNALKKVHKHIHENPNNVMFLTNEQISEIVKASEEVHHLTISTTKPKTPRTSKPKSNDLNIEDDDLSFGEGSFSLSDFLAKKKG